MTHLFQNVKTHSFNNSSDKTRFKFSTSPIEKKQNDNIEIKKFDKLNFFKETGSFLK